MKELTDRLAAIQAPISEEDQVVTLLGSLPPSYATLVTALEACADDVQLDFVQQALFNEEQKHFGFQKHSSGGHGAESALVQPKRPTEGKLKWPCHGFGMFGHFIRDCLGKKAFKQKPKGKHKAKFMQEDDERCDKSYDQGM